MRLLQWQYSFIHPFFIVLVMVLSTLLSEHTAYAAIRRTNSLEGNVRRLSDQVEVFSHELTNSDAEIRILKQKFTTLEDIVESLKRDMDSINNVQKVNLEVTEGHLKSKFNSCDGVLKGFASDLKELKSHTNQGTDAMQKHQLKIVELENLVHSQEQKIEHLKSLLNKLLTALDIEQDSSNDYATYRVKFGDSLGLIAQKHGVTIKSIKKLNALKSDTIFSGQKLKIPKQ